MLNTNDIITFSSDTDHFPSKWTIADFFDIGGHQKPSEQFKLQWNLLKTDILSKADTLSGHFLWFLVAVSPRIILFKSRHLPKTDKTSGTVNVHFREISQYLSKTVVAHHEVMLNFSQWQLISKTERILVILRDVLKTFDRLVIP